MDHCSLAAVIKKRISFCRKHLMFCLYVYKVVSSFSNFNLKFTNGFSTNLQINEHYNLVQEILIATSDIIIITR